MLGLKEDERKMILHGVTCEEIENAAGYDVVKILTDNPRSGEDAEFDWLQYRYPGASIWKQTIAKKEIQGKKTACAILHLTLEDGTRRKIIFDISLFSGGKKYKSETCTGGEFHDIPLTDDTELDFLEFNAPVLTGEQLESETKKLMHLIDLYNTYNMNGDAEKKRTISYELDYCFCDGRGREILNMLPVDYVLNLANCNLSVYINRDCYKLAGAYISKHRDCTGLAYVYAGNIAVEAAFISTHEFNAIFVSKTLQFFCNIMKNLSEINPGSLYIQEQYARILHCFMQYSGTPQKAAVLCKKELHRLVVKYPETNSCDSSLEEEKKFINARSFG